MGKTLILAVIIAIICGILLAFRVLFVKGGKFPTHHHNHADKKNEINNK